MARNSNRTAKALAKKEKAITNLIYEAVEKEFIGQLNSLISLDLKKYSRVAFGATILYGKLNLAQHLLKAEQTSELLFNLYQTGVNDFLVMAAKDGEKATMEFLLKTAKFKNYPDQVGLNEALIGAVGANHLDHRASLEVLPYLLTSPELDRHADPKYKQGFALQLALEYDKLDCAKILLNYFSINEVRVIYKKSSKNPNELNSTFTFIKKYMDTMAEAEVLKEETSQNKINKKSIIL